MFCWQSLLVHRISQTMLVPKIRKEYMQTLTKSFHARCLDIGSILQRKQWRQKCLSHQQVKHINLCRSMYPISVNTWLEITHRFLSIIPNNEYWFQWILIQKMNKIKLMWWRHPLLFNHQWNKELKILI